MTIVEEQLRQLTVNLASIFNFELELIDLNKVEFGAVRPMFSSELEELCEQESGEILYPLFFSDFLFNRPDSLKISCNYR